MGTETAKTRSAAPAQPSGDEALYDELQRVVIAREAARLRRRQKKKAKPKKSPYARPCKVCGGELPFQKRGQPRRRHEKCRLMAKHVRWLRREILSLPPMTEAKRSYWRKILLEIASNF